MNAHTHTHTHIPACEWAFWIHPRNFVNTNTLSLSLTFGEVSGEGGLGLLAVGDQLFGEEVHLDDL